MPPKTPHALQEHIGGGEIGDNKVEVDVHTLLHHLRGDEDAARTVSGPIGAKPFQPVLFEFGAAGKRKPAVQQTELGFAFADGTPEGAKRRLSFNDGVANPQHMLTRLGACHQGFDGLSLRDGFGTQGDLTGLIPRRTEMRGGGTHGTGGDERIAGGGMVFRTASGLEQFTAASSGQRGTEDDNRATEINEFAHQRGDEGAGVNIVGMNFIEDDHFAGEGEAADEEMFHGHDALQRLVNRAHAVRSKEGLFAGSKPGTRFADVLIGIIAVLRPRFREGRVQLQTGVLFQP